jgi:hypothetical protein
MGSAPRAARAQPATVDVETTPGKIRASGSVKMTATVLSIDMGSREVLLMDSQGKLHTINVSDEVRNLDRVRVGDKVTAEYTEAISLQLKKRGTADGPPASAQAAMVRSPQGAKPGGRSVARSPPSQPSWRSTPSNNSSPCAGRSGSLRLREQHEGAIRPAVLLLKEDSGRGPAPSVFSTQPQALESSPSAAITVCA